MSRHFVVPENRQLPSLNGWRAVAILLVLGEHLTFTNGFPAGWVNRTRQCFDGSLGVRFFFTISGFLITWLLLGEEKEHGAVSLKFFYARRALRILPVYLAALLVLAVTQMAGLSGGSWLIWVQLFTFTRNFYQFNSIDYFQSWHFWSLSIEEQFYLVWPVVFVLAGRGVRKRMVFLVFLILITIAWKIIYLLGMFDRHLYFLFQDHSTFMNLDCLAYGCIGAMLMRTREEKLKLFFHKYSVLIFLVACFFLLLRGLVGIGEGLQSVAFLFLLLHSVVQPEFRPFRLLNQRLMVQVGVLSYSIYIWQQQVFLLWPFPRLWFLTLPAVLVIGWVSYHFIEKRFFALRAKFRTMKSRSEA